MSDAQNDGFLGRWSRRKAQARAGQPLAEPPAPAPVTPAIPATPAGETATPADESALYESNRAPAPVPPAQAAIEKEVPALTLDDVKALTLDADFKPFVARSVAPEVRNAAFKKLFTDPHFNVMDGLDIYIDDYGQPDPLPASMLRQLASAKFMQLVEEEPEPPADADATLGAGREAAGDDDVQTATDAEQPCAADADDAVAQSDVCMDLPIPDPAAGPTGAPPDAHPDLRLQPDDAPGHPADRTGAA